MIKICHMTSAHNTDDVRIFRKECTSLAKAGYDVYLVGKGESREENGVHVIGLGQPTGGRLNRMTGFAKLVYQKALSLDADIYHFHDPELLPYSEKLAKAGKKVIFDSHEKYTEQLRRKPYYPDWAGNLIANVFGAYEKRVLGKIDGLIFPCLQNGKDLFAGLCKRTATVNNVPMLEELYDRYDPAAQKETRSICYIGSLTHARGITHLVQAAAKADCTLYLGGKFDTQTYQRQLEAMPEYACVRYLGSLNREQVVALLQKCQLGMATILNVGQYNQYDNLATKAYEYMAMGLPIILTAAPYNNRLTAQREFGLCVDPENTEELASAIRGVLDDPQLAKRMGENGRRAVKEEFNWAVEEQKLLALYEDILKN